MAAPFLAKVATANDLLEGDVVYFTRSGWSRHLEHAALAATPQDAEGLLAEASAHSLEVVGVTLIDVDVSSGHPEPVHFRERFRNTGPTNYFHGKQADV